MAAKKKEKLADFVEVYLPDSEEPVIVHKAMYDDPEEWKDAVRRAEKLKVAKEQEAFDEGMTDTPPSKLSEADSVVTKTEPVTAEVTPTRELTEEEVARENDPNFEASEFNMDGSRKTSEEQEAIRDADDTTTVTSPNEPETAPSQTTPEDADLVTKKTKPSIDVESMGSADMLEALHADGTVSDREFDALSKMSPTSRATFLTKRVDNRMDPRKVRDSNLREDNEETAPRDTDSILSDIGNTLMHPIDAIEAAKRGMQNMFSGGQLPPGYSRDPASGKVVQNADIDTPPPGAPNAPAPAPGAPPPTSVSGSVKTTIPGAVPRAPSDGVLQTMTDAEALRDGAARMAADAHAKKADIDRQALISQKSLQEQAFKDQQHIAEQRVAAEAAYSKSLSDGQAAMSSLMSERRQLLNQRVDPDHYWNEAGAGRRVSAVLAGALFGWAGQGMDYLQHLRGLVNDDIKLQQDELRRKGDTMDALVGDQKNIIALAKQKGMTDLEAVEAAKAARYEELTQQMQMLMTDAGVKNVNPALANTLAGLAQDRATALENAGKFRQQKAHEDAQIRLGYAKLAQDQREMSMKMRSAEQGPKLQEQKPQQQARLSEILNSGSLIGAMASEYRKQGAGKLAPVSSKLGLGMNATEGAKWQNIGRKFHAQTIGYGLEGGKLAGNDETGDYARYVNDFMPSVNDTEGAAGQKMQNLRNYAVSKYETELMTQAAAGIDVSGYPSPKQFAADIDTQIAGKLPGETPRK